MENQNHNYETYDFCNIKGKRKDVSYYNWNQNAESITQDMHSNNTPNIFLTLEKQVATKDTKKKNMKELCLKEPNNPTYRKNVNVL
jgi:hypothetical protein